VRCSGLQTGSHITDEEIRQAEEKFAESLLHAQMGMFNLLENDVSSQSFLLALWSIAACFSERPFSVTGRTNIPINNFL